MMRKIFVVLSAILLILTSCSQQQATTWQEQYDLGVRYLSEGNYEEAIIAFEAAIEIDPQQAIVYKQLSDAYQQTGELEKAIEILQAGYDITGDISLLESLEILQRHFDVEDKAFFLTEQNVYLADGTLVSQTEVRYDENGYMIEKVETTLSDITNQYTPYSQTWTYDPDENVWVWWAAYGTADTEGVSEILEGPREIGLDNCTTSFQSVVADVFVYPNPDGNLPEVIYHAETLDSDDAVWHHAEYEYDEQGNAVRITTYREDGSILGWCENSYNLTFS